MNAILVTGQSNANGTARSLIGVMSEFRIINSSEGGTSIEEWQKGGSLYLRAINMGIEAVRQGDRIVGMFHFQGEGNTNSQKKAYAYKKLTVKFFNQIRYQLNIINTPLIYAQLGTRPTSEESTYDYWSFVQAKQRQISHQYPEYKMIKTSDIEPHCPEGGVHWCQEGYFKIALRVKNKFQQLSFGS